jgi:hypothetical protein
MRRSESPENSYFFKGWINVAESRSKKRIAFECLLKIVAGQLVEIGSSKVFFTASAFIGAGTIQ